MKKALAGLAVVAAAVAAPVQAAPIEFVADVGDFIFPIPRGSSATATGTFTLNDAQTELSYYLTFDGLDLKENPADRIGVGDITAIHFHSGNASEVGPHALNVFGITLGQIVEDDDDLVVDWDANTISGVWDDSDLTPPGLGLPPGPSSVPLTSLISNLMAGEIYVNVHTAEWPSGEIRGQIERVPEVPVPAPLWLIGTVLLGLVARARRARN